jgi:hypothetical protein
MHIVRAGEFRRAVCWKLEVGSTECEFVSLINPSAGKFTAENNLERSETNSTNSQTHTPDDHESATAAQLQQIRKLTREGMSEKLAREEVLGKGWVEP